MKARDVMTSPVVTVGANATVQQAAELMMKRGISAVPVVGAKGELVGIVSEGDLMRRAETATGKPQPWWLRLLAGETALAAEFIKANARKVSDVMTRPVVIAEPDASLAEVAQLLERHAIKRVPIVHQGQVLGIVSRANLVQAFATASQRPHLEVSQTDTAIRERLIARMNKEPWAHTSLLNVLVSDGVVDLWGVVTTETEKAAVRVAAESTPGVRAVNDHLRLLPAEMWGSG